MRRVLSLDISTHAGWALLEQLGDGEKPTTFAYPSNVESPNRLLRFGNIVATETVTEKLKTMGYPWAYLAVARDMAQKFFDLIVETQPTEVVIEETNLGKNRYSQKTLEFLHCALLDALLRHGRGDLKVAYVSSAFWRSNLGCTLSKDDKKANARLAKAKRVAREYGRKPDLKKLGVRGKVNKKHVALRFVNERHSLEFKVKDNDIADAICLGTAYLNGAALCDGSMTNHGK